MAGILGDLPLTLADEIPSRKPFGRERHHGTVEKGEIRGVEVSANRLNEGPQTLPVGLGGGWGRIEAGVGLSLLPNHPSKMRVVSFCAESGEGFAHGLDEQAIFSAGFLCATVARSPQCVEIGTREAMLDKGPMPIRKSPCQRRAEAKLNPKAIGGF